MKRKRSADFVVAVTRTPGLAAAITIGAAVTGTAITVSVAGGDASVAAVLTNVAVAGANTAAQTFPMQTLSHDDSASATNHIAM